MSRAMPNELKKAIREVLKEGVDRVGTAYSPDFTRGSLEPLKQQATDHLIDLGALRLSGSEYTASRADYVTKDMIRVTAYGREYWVELNTWAPWYWFKKNIFPASVAFGTILFGGLPPLPTSSTWCCRPADPIALPQPCGDWREI